MTNTELLKAGFTDKPTYLAWRAAWKETYAELTLDIRHHKDNRKDESAITRASAQYQCWRLRRQATQMLAQRKQSKITAQEQYLACHPVAS